MGFKIRSLLNPNTHITRWLIASILILILIAGVTGYLEPIEAVLNGPKFTFKYGDSQTSLYKVLRACVVVLSLIWFASFISAVGKKQLKKMHKIKPSNRALLVNGFHIFVYSIILLIGLDVLGMDLTSFAVLGGAIGIGIGFGLQKITSNFISGIILLFEKSVEEGDLIELSDGTAGYIRNTGARFTLLETFDSKDIMIPNEDFITNRVTNWTFSNSQGRIQIPIGVSYESDIELARELMLTAARDHIRTSKTPEPQCYLREYGDSSVNFLLLCWVDDVTLGRYDVQSDIMREIWKSFKSHNITIPYPQRDIHIKSPGDAP